MLALRGLVRLAPVQAAAARFNCTSIFLYLYINFFYLYIIFSLFVHQFFSICTSFFSICTSFFLYLYIIFFSICTSIFVLLVHNFFSTCTSIFLSRQDKHRRRQNLIFRSSSRAQHTLPDLPYDYNALEPVRFS